MAEKVRWQTGRIHWSRKSNDNCIKGEETMACTKAALLNTFNQAVNIFNTESDNTIGGLLDENVTVYSHKHVSYSGIADVEDYFRQEFASTRALLHRASPALSPVRE